MRAAYDPLLWRTLYLLSLFVVICVIAALSRAIGALRRRMRARAAERVQEASRPADVLQHARANVTA